MGLGAFMAAAGTASLAAENWQRRQQQDANRKTLTDLEVQRAAMLQREADSRNQENQIRMRALQEAEAERAGAKRYTEAAGAMPWPGAGAAAGGVAPMPVAPGGAAGRMMAGAAGAPVSPAATPSMTPAPAASPVPAVADDEWKRQYDLAVEHKQFDRANQIRAGFVQAKQAVLLNALKQAYGKAEASGNPLDVIDVYNRLYPDGGELKLVGTDPATGNPIVEHSNGKRGALSLDAIGRRIYEMANSEEGVKLFGKILEEKVKGGESRKTEGVKGAESRKTEAQKAADAMARTRVSAGATVSAAKIAAEGGIERAKITAAGKGTKSGGLDPVKQAKEATILVYKSHGANDLSGIDPRAQPKASAQTKRAEQLALAGWPAGAAADKALEEWTLAEATARATKGKVIMPTDVPPPPYGVGPVAAAAGVPDKFTVEDDED